MNGFTPAQVKALQTWTEQRDALLRDLGVYSAELETTKAADTAAGLALADKHRQIAEAEGRLSVLDRLEETKKNSVSIEVAELEARKSRLETECAAQEGEMNASKREQGVVLGSTTALIAANKMMGDQAQIVKSVVSDLIETSKLALSDTKGIMADIKTISDQVIEKSTANIGQTNIILEKLPKYVFELQRPIPIRRKYPEGHPNAPVTPE